MSSDCRWPKVGLRTDQQVVSSHFQGYSLDAASSVARGQKCSVATTEEALIMTHQLSMTGEDWLSDRDRKTQARAEAARRKAALRAAEKLQAAADAVAEFSMACLECNDGSVRGADDSRVILSTSMREYAGWLESVFGK